MGTPAVKWIDWCVDLLVLSTPLKLAMARKVHNSKNKGTCDAIDNRHMKKSFWSRIFKTRLQWLKQAKLATYDRHRPQL